MLGDHGSQVKRREKYRKILRINSGLEIWGAVFIQTISAAIAKNIA